MANLNKKMIVENVWVSQSGNSYIIKRKRDANKYAMTKSDFKKAFDIFSIINKEIWFEEKDINFSYEKNQYIRILNFQIEESELEKDSEEDSEEDNEEVLANITEEIKEGDELMFGGLDRDWSFWNKQKEDKLLMGRLIQKIRTKFILVDFKALNEEITKKAEGKRAFLVIYDPKYEFDIFTMPQYLKSIYKKIIICRRNNQGKSNSRYWYRHLTEI